METLSLCEIKKENQAKEEEAATLPSCTEGIDISTEVSCQVDGNGKEWNLLSCLYFTIL